MDRLIKNIFDHSDFSPKTFKYEPMTSNCWIRKLQYFFLSHYIDFLLYGSHTYYRNIFFPKFNINYHGLIYKMFIS